MAHACCTLHQVLRAGLPTVRGSELRLPTGEVVPGVQRVTVTADSTGRDKLWLATVEMAVLFGEPITPEREGV